MMEKRKVRCNDCGATFTEVYLNGLDGDESYSDPEDPKLCTCQSQYTIVENSVGRTWEDGVKDAARIVQNEMRHKKALDHPNTRVHPAVFETLNEVELHLAAMLSRGSYESHDTVMQAAENPLWLNNEVQFARLLCEILATQEHIDFGELGRSMDLAVEHIDALFDRAEEVWEDAKAKVK